jgi:hypothetical protein
MSFKTIQYNNPNKYYEAKDYEVKIGDLLQWENMPRELWGYSLRFHQRPQRGYPDPPKTFIQPY